MDNKQIAKILYEIADILDVKGVEWKPIAYRKTAGNIETFIYIINIKLITIN